MMKKKKTKQCNDRKDSDVNKTFTQNTKQRAKSRYNKNQKGGYGMQPV